MMIQEQHILIQAKIETRKMGEEEGVWLPAFKLQASDVESGAHILFDVSKETFDELDVEQRLVIFVQRIYFSEAPHLAGFQDYIVDSVQIDGLEYVG